MKQKCLLARAFLQSRQNGRRAGHASGESHRTCDARHTALIITFLKLIYNNFNIKNCLELLEKEKKRQNI